MNVFSRSALEDQMQGWIDALEAKEGAVVSLRDRKINFEEDIKDAEAQIKSKYSQERARLERELQDLTERCALEIQETTKSTRETVKVTEASLREHEGRSSSCTYRNIDAQGEQDPGT